LWAERSRPALVGRRPPRRLVDPAEPAGAYSTAAGGCRSGSDRWGRVRTRPPRRPTAARLERRTHGFRPPPQTARLPRRRVSSLASTRDLLPVAAVEGSALRLTDGGLR